MRVQPDIDVFRAAVDAGDLWDKPSHGMKFSAGTGRTDFVVLPVQMDPKRTGGECLSGSRGEEAADLATHIKAVQSYFDDNDLIEIGDTECLRDDAEKLAEFEVERALDFEVGDVHAFSSGRDSFNRVMGPDRSAGIRVDAQLLDA